MSEGFASQQRPNQRRVRPHSTLPQRRGDKFRVAHRGGQKALAIT